MPSKVLLDTNVVIRFLVRDGGKHYEMSKDIFRDIQSGKIKVEFLDLIVAEIIYVLHSFYKHSKKEIVLKLIDLLSQENVYMQNKTIIFEALDVFATRNIDFADAILCAKKNLEGYEVMSFDKDVKKC